MMGEVHEECGVFGIWSKGVTFDVGAFGVSQTVWRLARCNIPSFSFLILKYPSLHFGPRGTIL